MEQRDEQELIDRARQGSIDAFEQLVIAYQDQLFRFLLIRAANRADAEDALQEAFVAAFKYLPGYRQKYRFSTWLFTIALRQLGRLRSRQIESLESTTTIACEQAGPEQLEIQSQRRHSIWQTAKRCLGGNQFTALWLFYVEDMPVAEISRVMKRPVSWVKVNLLRARRRMLREIQDEHFELIDSCQEVTL